MIDYEDSLFPLWGMGGGVGFVLFIIFLLIANCNDNDCQKKKCATGEPRLMNHDCLCVEKAK